MQDIFDRVGLPVQINNMFRHMTKGEMLSKFREGNKVTDIAVGTVSCGKWKRENIQCGRCLPCLIRRASFFKAGIRDTTPYKWPDLSLVLNDEDGRDDLVSVLAAIRRPTERMESWVLQAGPLPPDNLEREGYVDVFRRGLLEVKDFLASRGLA
jgi:hypothetical protein